uniref:Uncharacterized protein n=1 Tax=Arundo donax TaxID=35708 RepID=A0A0A9EEE3_ARUDO
MKPSDLKRLLGYWGLTQIHRMMFWG